MADVEYQAILNRGGVPEIGAGTLAGRPAAGVADRMYLVIEPADIYWSRDTGVSWRDIRSGETASQILAKLLTADGAGSGLDADTLDALNALDFALADGTRLRVYRSAAPPNSPAVGQIWEDTSTTPATLKHWNGTAWVSPQTNPLDGSVTNAKVAAGAAIAEAKLDLASDALAGVASRRTLGTGANQAAPGNDARLRTIRDEGVSLTNRAVLDFIGSGVIVEDDAATGRTKVTVSGAAAGAASEAAPGITEQATQAEVEAGTAGNLFATVARMAAEITRRQDARMGWLLGAGPQLLNAATVPTTGTLTADLRGAGGVPADAKGVVLSVRATAQAAGRVLYADSADATISDGSSLGLLLSANYGGSSQIHAPLGTGANAGRLRFWGGSQGSVTAATAFVNGWWR